MKMMSFNLMQLACLTALTMCIGQEKVNKENGIVRQGNGTVLKSEL
jgi:hypothetical protein